MEPTREHIFTQARLAENKLCAHHFDMSKCTTDAAYENWSYKDTFMRDDHYIQAAMAKISRRTFLEHLKRLEGIA
ncbi:hypothetical protein AAVH_20688 [Aphelenchoides avenae]|nr:hypothetical protein AAVH_20688 [Aphelenchus avenae]